MSATPLELVVYPAFGRRDSDIVIEGRVIERRDRAAVGVNDGKRRNLKRHLKMLINREVANLSISIALGTQREHAVTDAEGYFRILVSPRHALDAGWHEACAEASGYRGVGAVLVTPDHLSDAVISDVDDTLLVTGVASRRSLLRNSLLLNHTQRRPVERMPELLRQLVGAGSSPAGCVFYLSSTPRQLHASLTGFLEHHAFPRGVLITKRVTGDSTSEGLGNHHDYKLRRLGEIFERLPQVRFMLLGDDAEADPEIYAQIAQRYPQRVSGVWIREVTKTAVRAKLAGQGKMSELIARTLDGSATGASAYESR